MTTIWHQLDDNNFKWLQSLLLFGVYYDIPCIKFMVFVNWVYLYNLTVVESIIVWILHLSFCDHIIFRPFLEVQSLVM
jgi:hypothetical protein